MSCRVFSRRLEFATRRFLCNLALNLNCEEIKLCYFPTERNKMIKPILTRLGFQKKADNNEYFASSYSPKNMPKDFMKLDNTKKNIKYDK